VLSRGRGLHTEIDDQLGAVGEPPQHPRSQRPNAAGLRRRQSYGSFHIDLNSRLPIDLPRFGPKSVGTQILFSYEQPNRLTDCPSSNFIHTSRVNHGCGPSATDHRLQGGCFPGCGRKCASSATLQRRLVLARNADPENNSCAIAPSEETKPC
jgi:hypothetical protein